MDAKMDLAISMAIARASMTVRKILPRRSGNLADNAFRVKETKDGWEIYIDDLIAPYANYPNVKKKLEAMMPIIINRFVQDIAAAVNGSVV